MPNVTSKQAGNTEPKVSPKRQRKPRNCGKSYDILTSGSGRLGEQIKENSRGIIALKTDDLEIPLGYDLGTSRGGDLKIGICVLARDSTKQVHGSHQGRSWEVLTVKQERIKEVYSLG